MAKTPKRPQASASKAAPKPSKKAVKPPAKKTSKPAPSKAPTNPPAKKAPAKTAAKPAPKAAAKATKAPAKPAKPSPKAAPKSAPKKLAPPPALEAAHVPAQLPAEGASTAEIKPTRPTPDASRDFAQTVASIAANTRCTDVMILDVKGLSPITDYLVLATGQSGRQMRAVVSEVAEYGKSHNFSPLSRSGEEGETWICADFVDVILHIFSPDSRSYYDLESLWGDAKKIPFDPTKPLD